MKILIIEDNRILRENLCFLLKKFNFLAETSSNGKDALEKITFVNYDAIVLDVNMPIMGGKEFLSIIRGKGIITPVITLTSNSLLEDKLEMFDLGVDDYLTKPFEIEELIARLRSILNRKDKNIDIKSSVGDIEVNFSTNKIYKLGIIVDVPHKQYLIIEFLLKNLGYPQNKIKIMEYVWGEAEENLDLSSTTLESHIYSIRKKLGKDLIKTVKGVGYVIE